MLFVKLLKVLLIMALSSMMLAAQDVPASGAITIGEKIEAQTPDAYTLTIEDITPVTIVARSLDGLTHPSFTLLNPSNEVIYTVEINATYRNDMGARDVGLQNMMLTPGIYTIELNNAVLEDGSVQGDGRVSLEVMEGTQGILGAGYTEIIAASITVEKPVYAHEISLTAGEVVTIASRAVSSELITPIENPDEDAGLDTSLRLFAPDGSLVAANDDHDSDSFVLEFGDSQVARFVVPETGTYVIAVWDYENKHTGEVWLIATRHGTLIPSTVTPEVSTGRVLSSGRRTFRFDAEENELFTVTGSAVDEGFDTVITLYNPDGLPVVQNDDHNSLIASLGQFDSAVTNYLAVIPGTYELDIQGYDSGGSYEITLTRLGVVQQSDSTTPLFGSETEAPTQ